MPKIKKNNNKTEMLLIFSVNILIIIILTIIKFADIGTTMKAISSELYFESNEIVLYLIETIGFLGIFLTVIILTTVLLISNYILYKKGSNMIYFLLVAIIIISFVSFIPVRNNLQLLGYIKN